MDAVAELVRQCHHVARFAQVVEQHVGVDVGHRGVGEGAGGLAGLDRGVDPALVEEGFGDLAHAGVEGGIGVHHHAAGGGPVDGFLLFHRQGLVAVPDLHGVEAEPLALQLVVAVAELGVGGDDGVAQGLDHFRFDMVGEVPAGLGRGHLAPAVDDFLFLGAGVVDAGEGADVLAEDAGEFAGGGLALGALRFGEKGERAFDSQVLAVDGEGEPGDGFVEEPLPRVADDTEVVQEPLELVGELVGLHRADAVENRFVAGEVSVPGIHGGQRLVFQAVEFQREKHQRGGVIGDLLLAVGEEFRAARIGGDLVVPQAGEGHDAAGDVADLLVTLDAGQEARGVERGELAFVIGGKGGALGFQPVEIALELGGVLGAVEIGQVPFRQVAKVVGAGAGVGVEGGPGQMDHEALLSGLGSDIEAGGGGLKRGDCRGVRAKLGESGLTA